MTKFWQIWSHWILRKNSNRLVHFVDCKAAVLCAFLCKDPGQKEKSFFGSGVTERKSFILFYRSWRSDVRRTNFFHSFLFSLSSSSDSGKRSHIENNWSQGKIRCSNNSHKFYLIDCHWRALNCSFNGPFCTFKFPSKDRR